MAARDQVVRRASALSACTVLACGAMLGGMDTAALSSLFSAVLAGLLALWLALTPAPRLAALGRMHAAPLMAFALFLLWSLYSAVLTPAADAPEWRRALFHPLWAAFNAPNAAVSISPYRTLEGLAAFIGPAAAFGLGALSAEERKDRDFIGRLFVATTIALGGVCLFLLLSGGATNKGRLLAPFPSSNAAATMFGILAILLCALILRAARGRLSGVRGRMSERAHGLALLQQAPITCAALALALGCALLTGSRAGLACLAGGLAFFFALTRVGAKSSAARSGNVMAIVAGLAGVLLLVGGDFLASRFGTFGVDAEGRRLMIETHWNAFIARPLIGHGLNTFHELNAYYATVENWPAVRDIGAAHNIFVQMLEEVGVIGAGLFMLMLAPPLARALQISVEDRSGAEWAAAAFASATFAFAHGLVDFGLQVPGIAAILAFALGAFSSGTFEMKARSPAEPSSSRPADPRAAMRFKAAE